MQVAPNPADQHTEYTELTKRIAQLKQVPMGERLEIYQRVMRMNSHDGVIPPERVHAMLALCASVVESTIQG